MDYKIPEEGEILQKSARDFLTRECTKKHVREMEKDGKGYSPDLWNKMAQMGWLGLMLPDEYGGADAGYLELVLLTEEMGRALLPAPFIDTTVAALTILQYGNENQKKNFLPDVAEGKSIISLAIESAGNSGVHATEAHGSWTLNGNKLFVNYANAADWFLCMAESKHGRILCLVDATSNGINTTPLENLAAAKEFEVDFKDVKVTLVNILGKPEETSKMLAKIEEWGALAYSGLISGYIQQIMEMSVGYAKQRVQFNRLIGTFQAVQHLCANMLIDIDSVKLLTYEAACNLKAGRPVNTEVNMAKAWASDAARRVSLLGIKVHGGLGITVDYDMGLYFRRAKVAELAFGDGDYHRKVHAAQLGL